MPHTNKAILRESIPYRSDTGAGAAPRGEYDVEADGASVGLAERSGRCRFSLSIDAFQQHVLEGRIALR